MGSMSDYMIDNVIPMQRWVSEVTLTCPVCKEVISKEVDVPEPDYSAEKSRDMTVEDELEIECDSCENVFDAFVWAGPAHCEITLIEHKDVNVSCSPPGYDQPPEDWDEYWGTPEHPGEIFDANYDQLHNIIDAQATSDGASLMNRMIFAQIITFLEAYFCDNLITGLQNHKECLLRFASKDGAIQKDPVSAVEVLQDPEIVVKKIVRNLKEGRLYHNFGKQADPTSKTKPKLEGVPLWYRHAFDFSLTPSEGRLDELRGYAALRHDCVHRNGETKDGETLTVFNKDYLLKALYTAKAVVEHIDGNMRVLRRADEANPNAENGRKG